MTKMSRADHLAALIEKEAELRKRIHEHGVMTKAVDGARVQLERAVNDLGYVGQEMLGQIGIVKDDGKQLLKDQEHIRCEIRKIQRELGMKTMPGDSR